MIPKIDIAFVSKKQGAYSKYFMHISVNDLYYQAITTARESQKLFMLKNLEVIDKLTDRQKFSRALMKKEEILPSVELR